MATRATAAFWTRQLDRLQLELYALYQTMKDARVPWLAKLVAAAAIGYQLSPVQLVPDWVPLLGFADNFLVLAIAAALVRAVTPTHVLAECRERAQAAVMLQRRPHGRAARAMLVSVLLVWMLVAVAVSLLLLRLVLGGR